MINASFSGTTTGGREITVAAPSVVVSFGPTTDSLLDSSVSHHHQGSTVVSSLWTTTLTGGNFGVGDDDDNDEVRDLESPPMDDDKSAASEEEIITFQHGQEDDGDAVGNEAPSDNQTTTAEEPTRDNIPHPEDDDDDDDNVGDDLESPVMHEEESALSEEEMITFQHGREDGDAMENEAPRGNQTTAAEEPTRDNVPHPEDDDDYVRDDSESPPMDNEESASPDATATDTPAADRGAEGGDPVETEAPSGRQPGAEPNPAGSTTASDSSAASPHPEESDPSPCDWANWTDWFCFLFSAVVGSRSYDIFISHAGEQNEAIVFFLYKALKRNHRPFFDRTCLEAGGHSLQAMEQAMRSCRIGLFVLSPEFVAKKHPMQELKFLFQRHFEEQEDTQESATVKLFPIFFELTHEDCGLDKKAFFSKYRDTFNNPEFEFYDRVARGETSEDEVIELLQNLRRFVGIENQRGPNQVVEDTVKELLDLKPKWHWYLRVGAIAIAVAGVIAAVVVVLVRNLQVVPPPESSPTLAPSVELVAWLQRGPDLEGDDRLFGVNSVLSEDGRVLAVSTHHAIHPDDEPEEERHGGRALLQGKVQVWEKMDDLSWVQRGNDFWAESEFANPKGHVDAIGMSGDGSIVVIGSHSHGEGNFLRRKLSVYRLEGGMWMQMGTDVEGDASYSLREAATPVAISADGTTVALVTSALRNGDNGFVQVYRYNEQEGDWKPLGDAIVGRERSFGGRSVALSGDGNTVATGSWRGGSDQHRYSRVYRYSQGKWTQMGSELDIDAYSVSLSYDGQKVAIGSAWKEDSIGLLELIASAVRIHLYNFNGEEWSFLGGDELGVVTDGAAEKVQVALSPDASIVAVGIPPKAYDGAGRVRVYQYNELHDSWLSHGRDLREEPGNGCFGRSVAVTNKGIVAVGIPFCLRDDHDEPGRVRFFERDVDDIPVTGSLCNRV